MIYFIQSDGNGLIKIGSSTDPERRLRELQTGSSAPLRILLTLPGTSEEEVLLHEHFRNCRQQGEWYLPLKELLDFIYNPIGALLKSPALPQFDLSEFEKQRALEKFNASAGAKCDCGGNGENLKAYLNGEAMLWMGVGFHHPDCMIFALASEFDISPEESWIESRKPILNSTVIHLSTNEREIYPVDTPEVIQKAKTIIERDGILRTRQPESLPLPEVRLPEIIEVRPRLSGGHEVIDL